VHVNGVTYQSMMIEIVQSINKYAEDVKNMDVFCKQ
jgi:hypothetical protein